MYNIEIICKKFKYNLIFELNEMKYEKILGIYRRNFKTGSN